MDLGVDGWWRKKMLLESDGVSQVELEDLEPITMWWSELQSPLIKPSKHSVLGDFSCLLPSSRHRSCFCIGLRSWSYGMLNICWSACGSVQFSHSVVSSFLRPHELQHARPPCPSPTPGVYSNSCPLGWWCHPTISSSVVPFSCPQSFPASGSFTMSQFFASGGQSIGVSSSTSVLPMNIQDWFPLG